MISHLFYARHARFSSFTNKNIQKVNQMSPLSTKPSAKQNNTKSEHLHEDLKPASYLKPSNSSSNFLEVPQPRVEEMQTREVNVLHLVEVNHAFVDVFVPCHPGLFLVLEFGDHLWALNRIVFAVHGDEIPVEG